MKEHPVESAKKTTSPEPSGIAPALSVRRFIMSILPRVSKELKYWDRRLNACYDWSLLVQAASSLRRKRFHAQGGSFFALYNPHFANNLVTAIVALQTISDYLDNLCDRNGVYSEAAFRHLHQAMLDALTVGPLKPREYYLFYPSRRDGGYLNALVAACRRNLAAFPSYPAVQKEVLRLAGLYNDLQVYKHLDLSVRRSRLKKWHQEKATPYSPPIYWWEFAASCGSTLSIFALLAAATLPQIDAAEIAGILEAYLPWVCGLHILLDYFIDQEEDRKEKDFNFVACYPSARTAEQRLRLFLEESLRRVAGLRHPAFHRTIIHGLLAVYLSDAKVKKQGFQHTAGALLDSAGSEAKTLYYTCLALRRIGIL